MKDVFEAIILGLIIFFVGVLVGALIFGDDRAPPAEATATIPRPLPDGVAKFHDASDEVTCWTVKDSGQSGKSISCLPDQALATARREGGGP